MQDKCTEEPSRAKNQQRKPCGHRYHYHHHYRHRCRLRSNSCERIEILQRNSGPDASICRSKSNVEICLYHKKGSKNQRDESSTSFENSSNELESSSSEYCLGSYRRKRDAHRAKSKTKKSSKKEPDEKEKSPPPSSLQSVQENSMYITINLM